MKHFRLLFIVITAILYCGNALSAQNKTLDSLKNILKTSKSDTNEVRTLIEISKELTNTGAYDKAKNYAEQAHILANQLRYQSGIAEYYSTIGIIYYYEGNIPEALNGNLASLKIRDSIGDKKGTAGSYNNLAIIYNYLGNQKEALRYLLLALQIKEDLGDKKGVVTTYNNIGLAYSDMGNYDEALKYLKIAKIKSEETGNKKSEANALQNIGGVYYTKKQYDTALVYFKNALAIREQLGNRQGIVSSMITTGESYTQLKEYKLAHVCLDTALPQAIALKNKEGIKNAYQGLATLAEAENNFKDAYNYYKSFREAQDLLQNDENTKKAIVADMNYKFEHKQTIEKAEREKEKIRLEEIAKKQEQTVYFISGILLLVIVFAIFVYRGFLQKRNANRELDIKNTKIEQAYKIIETKNQEITDSINYAQRIQNAILPSNAEILEAFPESFVFYRPKDIVGGDFYYFSRKNNSCYIAAADCTGHGVPGAFMSLIGSKELQLANEIVSSPGKILQQINIGLKETLKQNHLDATKDGMDMAFLKIENNMVDFSGANRPLWIMRKSTVELEEIKPTKAAIGGFTPDNQEFSEHHLIMSKGDSIYFFTDG
ncbi:MAG TPA: tetratricopeptide repeat protein, partial [Bacteroidia bacterium]|nr:tetratricopeptide repeat protein [Bacteroidia bacterium]